MRMYPMKSPFLISNLYFGKGDPMPNRFKKSMKHLAAAVCLTLSCVMPCAAQEFLPVSEVQEGMHGYAKTVVHGTKIETFDVDVLGIMKGKGATGGDLVLVKVSGPLIDQTEGIAQGMSGSPVYIDGKLLGAVAYGFPQSGGRIGMVTPIGDMLKLWTIDDGKDTGLTPPSSKGLIPLTTPLMASGYTPDAMDFLAGKMQDFHMVPFASASASQDDVPQPLEPGSAVSATMVTGDLKLGAVGTVTYVDGDRMVAFGHPFMDRGNTDYFMHNSYIFTVIPSKNIPFKLGSVGAEIGTVNQDRGAGIGGMMGPTLSVTSVYHAISNAMDRKGQGTVDFTYTLYPEDMKQKPFTRSNMYWSSKDIAERSVDELYNVVRLLEQNRFEKYPLRSIMVDMHVTSERKTAQLLDASASPIIVSPGDTIYVRARLSPYRGEVFYKDLTFTVPKDQPYGDMILEVRGGGVVPLPYLIQQQKFNLTDEILDRIRTYKDFNDLHSRLMKEDQNNQVVVEILDPEVSMISKDENGGKKAEIQEKKAPENPDYLKNKDGLKEDGEKETPKSAVDTDYVIYGDGQFTFKVLPQAERDKALKKLAKSKQQATIEMSNKEKETLENKDKKTEGTDKDEKDSQKTSAMIAL